MNSDFSMQWLTATLDNFFAQWNPYILATGNDILWSVAAIILVIYALKHGATGGLILFLLQYVPMVLIAANLLKYYAQPMPLLGTSVHQFFSVIAADLASHIDQTRQDVLYERIASLLVNLQKPDVGNLIMLPIYFMVELDMWIIEAFLFCVTAFGFLAIGIGNIMGPLFIPWMIVPRLSHWFWGWIEYMVQYNLYRVVAAAAVSVISTFITTFLDASIHGNYSLVQMTVLIPRFSVVTLFAIIGCASVPLLVSGMLKGTSAPGPRFRIGKFA